MGVKENCTQWIELAYNDWLEWLRTEKKQTYLRDSTKNIVSRMKTASQDTTRKDEAWNILERLKRLANNFNNLDDVSSVEEYMYEPSEINVECALVAYKMDDLQEALTLLKTPNGAFPARSLHKAISYWLYGCVQWQSQSHLEDALVSWEKSIQITKEVKSDKANDLALVRKCEDILELMVYAIREASKSNTPPPVQARKKSQKSNARIRSAKLMTFPVYGRISAGPASWIPPVPDSSSEISTISINEKFYSFLSLRDELTIKIQSGKMYYLLEVKGESMNKAEPVQIENGDFVLLVKQEAAESGDIVAAEIIREDEIATLKRYRFKNNQHMLEPETDVPDLSSHISITKDFHIRGIVLAVLKPL